MKARTCVPVPSAQWDGRVEVKLGNPEEGDEKVARQALPQEEDSGAVAAPLGQEETLKKEGRCNQGTAGVLGGSSATFGAERPRRGRESTKGATGRLWGKLSLGQPGHQASPVLSPVLFSFWPGDVMGPTLNHLNSLLRLPFGCGEQNVIHFAPNVFVLKYLQKTQQLSPEVEKETTDYLVLGYQRQLTYRHQDGSYSAFGERDASGSMYAWELSPCSPAPWEQEERGAIARARHFLESGAALVVDPYSSALTAYVLTLLHSPTAPAALRRLRSLAITRDGVTHWSLMGSRDVDEDVFLSFSDGVSQSGTAHPTLGASFGLWVLCPGIDRAQPASSFAVVSAKVEMTAYALLTYTLLGDMATALLVVKWLSQQRNALGGFPSTQASQAGPEEGLGSAQRHCGPGSGLRASQEATGGFKFQDGSLLSERRQGLRWSLASREGRAALNVGWTSRDAGRGTAGCPVPGADSLPLCPQDTCVALQALAEYAILSYAGGINLTVSLASTNLDYQETLELHRANQKVLQTAAVHVPGTRVGSGDGGPSRRLPPCMSAEGITVSSLSRSPASPRGCSAPKPQSTHTFQIDVTYNVRDPVAKPAFQLLVSLQEPEAELHQPPRPASSADDDDPEADQHHQEYQVTLEVCTRGGHMQLPSEDACYHGDSLGAQKWVVAMVPEAHWSYPVTLLDLDTQHAVEWGRGSGSSQTGPNCLAPSGLLGMILFLPQMLESTHCVPPACGLPQASLPQEAAPADLGQWLPHPLGHTVRRFLSEHPWARPSPYGLRVSAVNWASSRCLYRWPASWAQGRLPQEPWVLWGRRGHEFHLRLEFTASLPLVGRWLHAGSSNMAVLEVPLLSGFRADGESLEQCWGASRAWEALTAIPSPRPVGTCWMRLASSQPATQCGPRREWGRSKH
ncbi:hypothetical protein HPG69_017506 [Diceros bicornis minor]|uniref:Alpha-macroglobulin-like TED domain-containing protein n=1 Tax=Diceros bicornis minor TaxID=77932 RepID=A0A7J7ED43_DICBM|nr:hypothetical protein HPG69_017506 [Diceros bicornis minor]